MLQGLSFSCRLYPFHLNNSHAKFQLIPLRNGWDIANTNICCRRAGRRAGGRRRLLGDYNALPQAQIELRFGLAWAWQNCRWKESIRKPIHRDRTISISRVRSLKDYLKNVASLNFCSWPLNLIHFPWYDHVSSKTKNTSWDCVRVTAQLEFSLIGIRNCLENKSCSFTGFPYVWILI